MPFERNSEEAKNYAPPRLNQKQIGAIEYIIAKSQNATEFAKKVVIWLIRQTDNLTKQVVLSVPEQFLGEPARQIQDAVHDMCSVNSTTHINSVFKIADTEMRLQHHSGRRMNGGYGEGRTIWCAYEEYSTRAELLNPPRKEDLEKIDLHKITHPWECN